jgi:hypothetical protein
MTRNQTRIGVEAAAGGKADDESNRFAFIERRGRACRVNQNSAYNYRPNKSSEGLQIDRSFHFVELFSQAINY